MAGYDVLMVLTLIGTVALGAWRGMAWQVAPFASLVLGYVVALPASGQLAPLFGSKAPMNQIVALLVVYVAVSLAVYLVTRTLRGAVEHFKLEAYDRHLGSILGGVKGVMLCLVITLVAVAISPAAREQVMQSKSGYAVAVVLDKLQPIIPAGVHEVIAPYVNALDSTVAKGQTAEPKPEETIAPASPTTLAQKIAKPVPAASPIASPTPKPVTTTDEYVIPQVVIVEKPATTPSPQQADKKEEPAKRSLLPSFLRIANQHMSTAR